MINKIISFYTSLSKYDLELPNNYYIINPYTGKNRREVLMILKRFYHKYYNKDIKRFMVLR